MTVYCTHCDSINLRFGRYAPCRVYHRRICSVFSLKHELTEKKIHLYIYKEKWLVVDEERSNNNVCQTICIIHCRLRCYRSFLSFTIYFTKIMYDKTNWMRSTKSKQSSQYRQSTHTSRLIAFIKETKRKKLQHSSYPCY